MPSTYGGFNYIIDNGIETLTDYPKLYSRCKKDESKSVYPITTLN